MNGKDFKKEASEIFSFPLLKAMEENKSSEINLFQIGVELNIIRKRINENQETYYNNFRDERHLENLLLVNYLMVDIQSLYIFMNKYLNYLVQFLHQNYFTIVNKFQQDTFASHFKKVDEWYDNKDPKRLNRYKDFLNKNAPCNLSDTSRFAFL